MSWTALLSLADTGRQENILGRPTSPIPFVLACVPVDVPRRD